MQYTEEQIPVIDHDNGHALIGACPGSGKTTTLAALIRSLLFKGNDPRGMLVLMFGSDAQKEFVKKLSVLVQNDNLTLPAIRTYHSIGFALCGALEKRGDLPVRRLEDKDKQLELLAMEALKSTMSHAEYKKYQDQDNKVVELFVNFIDIVKSGLLPVAEVFDDLSITRQLRSAFCSGFDKFEDLREQRKVRFFSDLLYDPVKLLLQRKDLREWLGNKKSHIIVDEFQDTNSIQYELLKIVAGDKANVIVVGDIKQSIFEWRGSDIELMRHQFAEDFKNVTRYSLSYTFRYGHELAMVANNLISNNVEGEEDLCVPYPTNPQTTVDIHGDDNPGKAALSIIKNEIKSGRSLNDIVVLCRLYSSATPIELELLASGIPCGTASGYSVLDSKEFKIMRNLLEIADGRFVNLTQSERKVRFEEMLKFPHLGVKNEAVNQVANFISKENRGFGFSLRKAPLKDISKYQKIRLNDRGWAIAHVEASGKKRLKASDIIDTYIDESEWFKSIKSMALSVTEATETIDRINFLLKYIKDIDGLSSEVLDKLDAVRESSNSLKDSTTKVLITSIHKAKGLEWPVVIMPGLDENRFPFKVTGDYMVQAPEEAERRLCFVGMTRAIDQLHLLAPADDALDDFIKKGKKPGRVSRIFGSPVSQFIYETDIMAAKRHAKTLNSGESLVNASGVFEQYNEKLCAVAS